ncbi:DUF423 domain-containing protein [Muriicola sp. Z0-33]|uniref:DUF423 domain-containing protein n=1 Tax=Muriicola sp. Z0-33 TaxID=2816957 RepID=UPI002237B94E|nr:DUF423 domain-containing protein [Muriicola sp. Z0-33]MCW5515017.1 DUF423 domain-containing protein [Muriicola sp. Z0-33]
MNKTILGIGIFFGVSAILLGAFGAHGLEKFISEGEIATYETGVMYQMYHALFLLIVACIDKVKTKDKKAILILIILGVVCFSFSLYFLATNSLTTFDFKSIAFITPIGGVLLISGWLVLAYRLFKQFN